MQQANFAERLSEVMLEKNIKPDMLQTDLGFATRTIYHWLKDGTDIRLSNFVSLCLYFDCSLDFMAGRSENNSKPRKKELPNFMDSLRAVMKRKGITTYKLRKETHFSGGHFDNWDKGTDPQLSTLIELANYFNCSLDELVGLE